MGRIVSIVAQDPNFNGNERDSAIEGVMKKIDGKHEFFRVPSVELLGRCLVDDKGDPPDRIQVIGHGARGMLSLGFHWTHTYSATNPSRHFVLDSNPGIYGVLNQWVKKQRVKPTTEIWLLGCKVGTPHAGPGATVADGPTLIFDLSRMLRCAVRASTQLVVPDHFGVDDHFGADGVFLRQDTLARADGQSVTIPDIPLSPLEPPLKPISILDRKITFQELTGAPILGLDKVNAMSIPVPEGQGLSNAFIVEVNVLPLLAMPEVEFMVEWRGTQWKAESLADGSVLRLRSLSGDEVHDVIADPSLDKATRDRSTREAIESLIDMARTD